jgi:hypothetical protein
MVNHRSHCKCDSILDSHHDEDCEAPREYRYNWLNRSAYNCLSVASLFLFCTSTCSCDRFLQIRMGIFVTR